MIQAATEAARQAGGDPDLERQLQTKLEATDKEIERKQQPKGVQLESTKQYLTRAIKRAEAADMQVETARQALLAAEQAASEKHKEVEITKERITQLERDIAMPAVPPPIPPQLTEVMEQVRGLLEQVQSASLGDPMDTSDSTNKKRKGESGPISCNASQESPLEDTNHQTPAAPASANQTTTPPLSEFQTSIDKLGVMLTQLLAAAQTSTAAAVVAAATAGQPPTDMDRDL